MTCKFRGSIGWDPARVPAEARDTHSLLHFRRPLAMERSNAAPAKSLPEVKRPSALSLAFHSANWCRFRQASGTTQRSSPI